VGALIRAGRRTGFFDDVGLPLIFSQFGEIRAIRRNAALYRRFRESRMAVAPGAGLKPSADRGSLFETEHAIAGGGRRAQS
jgi:hypothetical protein